MTMNTTLHYKDYVRTAFSEDFKSTNFKNMTFEIQAHISDWIYLANDSMYSNN